MIRKAAHNRGLNARQAEVQNSTFVLPFGFPTKLNILLCNPALRQAPNRYTSWYTSSENRCTKI
ncbi:MAG: hypothetical protein IPP37_19640 [Saprospiraceae bacterium]|nr:hypothetical protein [Saprospiraceae bacterium]MBL0084504.1 hypothetical protein [Saprospiraceae bacterium]